ncbi:MAG: hypothetical protein LBS70_08905 [Candidatus Accumulibacter sp.]|nr:hypothetical protein [Accumulibacter sp.]
MGIFDWFRERPAQSEPEGFPAELVRQAIERASALTDPRLRLLESRDETLRRPMEAFLCDLRDALTALPPAIPASEANWAGEPTLRAFFASAPDVTAALAASRELRAFFEKRPSAGRAYAVLEAEYKERRDSAPSLRSGGARQDIARTVLDFSAPAVHLCGQDETEVRRLIGTRAFEYLIAQAMTEIAEARDARRGLDDARSLLQARLRLLQQQSSAAPENDDERRRLEFELQENERKMEEHGDTRAALERELECLRRALERSREIVAFQNRRPRLDTLNAIVEETEPGAAAEAAFTLAALSTLTGAPQSTRAFVTVHIDRESIPRVKLDIANAERFL